jgi:hypothetical protein
VWTDVTSLLHIKLMNFKQKNMCKLCLVCNDPPDMLTDLDLSETGYTRHKLYSANVTGLKLHCSHNIGN